MPAVPKSSDRPQLYRIDLATGAASLIGEVGGLACTGDILGYARF